MFEATLIRPFRFSSNLTKGANYQVIDFNDYFGTYTVIDDNGKRCNVDWMQFADAGKASEEYKRSRVLAAA